MIIEQKKAAVDLTALALGIVILGVVAAIGAVIFQEFGASQITSAGTNQIANESVTFTNNVATLANTWVKGVNVVVNGSGNQLITSGNYSLSVNPDTGVGTITNLTTNSWTTWKVTYEAYNITDPRFLIPSKAQLGLAEYGNWFKILVIVGIAAVLLALIFMAFGNKSSQSTGTSY